MKRVIVGCAVLMSLSGCATYSLEELRRIEPTGTPFQKALSRYYKEFAISEERQYDWADSMHFADKGLRAAYGKDVAPEDPAHWSIPQDRIPEMQIAYDSLKDVLASGAMDSKPEIAARAQYYFDCWLEQQEENWQLKDIAYCRDGFKDTMDTLLGRESHEEIVAELNDEEVVTQPVKKAAAQPEPMKKEPVAPAVEPMAEEKADAEHFSHENATSGADMFSYIVFFEKKQTEISAAGKKAVEDVLSMAKAGGKYEFILNSHTDRAGEDMENQKLTEERARVVKEMLVEGGVTAADIKIYAFGESDPPVQTADGVEEPANQRVEILLNE